MTFLLLEITAFLKRKVHYLGTILNDDHFFIEITAFLGQKAHYLGTISNDTFFLEINAFLGQEMHYPGTISSNKLLFSDHLEPRTKIALEHYDVRTSS